MRAGLYSRVSTTEQTPENQLVELRRYAEARGWSVTEYTDHGVSGSKDSRPALNALLRDAKRRKLDVVVCWRLDRLGRSLKHLVVTLDELQTLGVAFVSLNEGIDCTTPAGRLQMAVLAAIAQFEKERIVERVRAGLARARAQGQRLGRPRKTPSRHALAEVAHLPLRAAAVRLGISKSALAKVRASTKPISRETDSPSIQA
jgi:DNA invertase Pin-like site-specific DNA recombinase